MPKNMHLQDWNYITINLPSEVEMYGQYIGRGGQFVHCRKVVHSSEVPL